MHEFEGAIIIVREGLHRLAPAAIENRGRRRNTRRGRRVLCPHDADQHVDGRPGVAARERADFGEGLGNWKSAFARSQPYVVARRCDADDPDVHDRISVTTIATRPSSASDIRYAVMGSPFEINARQIAEGTRSFRARTLSSSEGRRRRDVSPPRPARSRAPANIEIESARTAARLAALRQARWGE